MAEINSISYQNATTEEGTEMLQDFDHNQEYTATKLETIASGGDVPEPPVFTSGVMYNPGTPLKDERTCCCDKIDVLQANLNKFECRMAAALQFHTDTTLTALQQTLKYQQHLVEINNQKSKKMEACLKDISQAISNHMG